MLCVWIFAWIYVYVPHVCSSCGNQKRVLKRELIVSCRVGAGDQLVLGKNKSAPSCWATWPTGLQTLYIFSLSTASIWQNFLIKKGKKYPDWSCTAFVNLPRERLLCVQQFLLSPRDSWVPVLVCTRCGNLATQPQRQARGRGGEGTPKQLRLRPQSPSVFKDC